MILTTLILSCLPSEFRLKWAQIGEGHESDLSFLLDFFLQTEVLCRERSQIYKEPTSYNKTDSGERHTKVATTAALATTSNLCLNCKHTHATEKCGALLKSSISDRKLKFKELGLCFPCLKQGHLCKNCNSVCAKCNGSHHALPCFQGKS